MKKVEVVVLAGGEVDDELAKAAKEREKAFIKFRNRTLVEMVVDAFSPVAERILVVGNVERLKATLGGKAETVEGGGSMLENLKKGMERVEGESAVVAAVDVLMPDSHPAKWFVLLDLEDCDVVYPVVEKNSLERRLGESKRTYVRFREGTFTGGNIFFLKKRVITEFGDRLEKLIRMRKSPIKLATWIGLGVLLKAILGLLSLSDLERLLEEKVGLKGCAVISPYPEIGVDLDKYEDYLFFKEVLEKEKFYR